MKIAVDLDGVLYDFDGALREVAHRLNVADPEILDRPPTQWDFFLHDWGLSREQFHALMLVASESKSLFNRPCKVYPGAAEGMAELKAKGHTLHIVTSRAGFGSPSKVAAQTFEWLEEEEIPYDTVTFASDKSLIRADIAIDDAPHHWRAYTDDGVVCVLREHLYNNACAAPLRVASFAGFVALVESLDHGIDIPAIANWGAPL